MTANKPSQVLGWIPDNTTNILNPDAVKTAGFTPSSLVSSSYNNWLFNRTSQWINFLNNRYIDSDTTTTINDLTEFAILEDLLTYGVEIGNGAVWTIELALPASTVTLLSINNIKGGNLVIKKTAGTYDLSRAIKIQDCTASITFQNIRQIIRSASADFDSCVVINNCREVIFDNCYIEPVTTITTTDSLVSVNNSFAIFKTGSRISNAAGFPVMLNLINNSKAFFSGTGSFGFWCSNIATAIYLDNSSTFVSDITNIFVNCTDDVLPVLGYELKHLPSYPHDLLYKITAANTGAINNFLQDLSVIDCNIEFKSTVLSDGNYPNLSADGLSGKGKIKLTNTGATAGFNIISFSGVKNNIELDFIDNALNCNIGFTYCDNVSVTNCRTKMITFQHCNNIVVDTCVAGGTNAVSSAYCYTFKNCANVVLDNAGAQYYDTTAFDVQSSRVYLGATLLTKGTTTPSSVIDATKGSLVHVNYTGAGYLSGEVIKVSDASQVIFNGVSYLTNHTVP